MPGLITDIPDALKIKYPPRAVQTMIQEDLVFRPRLKRDIPSDARVTDGYEMRFGARLDPANNVSQMVDGGNFPIQKDAVDRQFVFKPTMFAGDYMIGLLTRHLVTAAVGFNGGEMARRPEETMSNLGKLIESTFVGTTGTGIRAYVESEPGANQIKLRNPEGTRLLRTNYYISERIAAASTVRDSIDLRNITDTDDANRTITYSGADQTPVAGDPIYIVPESGLAGATLGVMHANGLRGQVDDGDNNQFIHTLDRLGTGNRKLQSFVSKTGGAGRNIGESLLLNTAHECARRSQKRPSTLIMGEGQAVKYVEHVAPQKRFPAMGRQRPGKSTGYIVEELSFTSPYGAMDFMLSFDALPGELYGVSWDSFFHFSGLDAQWLTGHDVQNLLLLPGSNGATHKAAFGAYLISIENWGTDYPPGHFCIRDLFDPLLGT